MYIQKKQHLFYLRHDTEGGVGGLALDWRYFANYIDVARFELVIIDQLMRYKKELLESF